MASISTSTQLEAIDEIARNLINEAVSTRKADWLSDDENVRLVAVLNRPWAGDDGAGQRWQDILDVVEDAADYCATNLYLTPSH